MLIKDFQLSNYSLVAGLSVEQHQIHGDHFQLSSIVMGLVVISRNGVL
jgi:hypothetical protein